MKKIAAIFLTLVMIISCSSTAFALSSNVYLRTGSGTKNITAVAKQKSIHDYEMVSAKAVLQAAGAGVTWSKEAKSLGAKLPNQRIMVITYDGTSRLIVQMNGQTKVEKATVPPELVNGTAMIATVDIARILGGTACYDPSTNSSIIDLVDGIDSFRVPTKDDDLCSVEEFKSNYQLQKAYAELSKVVVKRHLKYPNTAFFDSNFKVTKHIQDENSPSLAESLEIQTGKKLDAETRKLFDDFDEEYGTDFYEHVDVKGYVTSQTGLGFMKQIPFHVTFDVVDKTVYAVYLDNECITDYFFYNPSYTLEGLYY